MCTGNHGDSVDGVCRDESAAALCWAMGSGVGMLVMVWGKIGVVGATIRFAVLFVVSL